MKATKHDILGLDRLKKRSDFLRAQGSGEKWVSKSLIVQTVRNGLDKPRFGLTASKRLSKTAVVRNRVRRRLRAAAYDMLPHMAETGVDNWNPVTGEELQGFLGQVAPIDGKYNTSAETSNVDWRPLPFYERVVLIRVKDTTWTPQNLVIYYLTLDGNLYRLNGTSPPIHEVNATAPVKVTEENVLDYLRFFCFFVRGEEGPFLIAEDIDNPDLPKGMDDQTKAVVEGTIRPASYEGKNEQDFFMCDGVVFYSNALFIANFAVQPGGMIEMLNDEPIAADLPVRVDCPIA